MNDDLDDWLEVEFTRIALPEETKSTLEIPRAALEWLLDACLAPEPAHPRLVRRRAP